MQTVPLPNPGEVFEDRYRVEQQIGQGGFSRVYRAIDTRAGDRVVALKILVPVIVAGSGRQPSYDGDLADRFLREAQVLASLDNPYTIKMFDHGKSAQGTLFMVFEFIEGRSVFEAIRDDGAQPIERVVAIIEQTLLALQNAHTLGILHRDIKPNNLMVTRAADAREHVKVLDFGIAKAFSDAAGIAGNDLTAVGTLVGTPRYMPPEQLKGLPMGPASDLYSLGIVSLEMLTGKKAIPGKDRMMVIQAQLMPEPLKVPPHIAAPPQLRAIIERLLAKNVRIRYSSAAEALRDLHAWRKSDIVSSVPPPRSAVSDDNDATVLETVDMAKLDLAKLDKQTVDMPQRVFRTPSQEQTVLETVDMAKLLPDASETVDMAKLQREPSKDRTVLKTVNVAELEAAAAGKPLAENDATIQASVSTEFPSWSPPETIDPPTDQMVTPAGARLPGDSSGSFAPPVPAATSTSGLTDWGEEQQRRSSGDPNNPGPWDTSGHGSLSSRQSFSVPDSSASSGQMNAWQTPTSTPAPPASASGQIPMHPSASGQMPVHPSASGQMPVHPSSSGQWPADSSGQNQWNAPQSGWNAGDSGQLQQAQPGFLAPTGQTPFEMTSTQKILLAVSFFLPGLAHIAFGQVKKGGLIILGLFLTLGTGYLLSLAVIADAYLVLRAKQKRPVGDWEFFPDIRELLS